MKVVAVFSTLAFLTCLLSAICQYQTYRALQKAEKTRIALRRYRAGKISHEEFLQLTR